MNKIKWGVYKFSNNSEDEEDDDDEDEDDFSLKSNNKPGFIKFPNNIITTPIGDVSALDGWSPFIDRNIYIANTNFVITDIHIKLIAIILGVEYISVISPYSFAVIVGVMFDEEEVIYKIEDVINIDNDVDVSDYINKDSPLYDMISPTLDKIVDNKYWLFFVFPNGKVFERIYETEEELDLDIINLSDNKINENFEDYSECIYFTSKKESD